MLGKKEKSSKGSLEKKYKDTGEEVSVHYDLF
jgi:hypothetical protein